MMDVPDEMATDRLIMRPPRPGDGERINAVVRVSAAEVGQWMQWASPTPEPEVTEKWCREAASKFITREAIHYVLRLKACETIVGVCGFHRFDWAVPLFEIGYWLRTTHCGKGLMTEAVARLEHVGFNDLSANRLEIRCDVRNERSDRVAERLGFRPDGVLHCDSRGVSKELRDTRIYSKRSVRTSANWPRDERWMPLLSSLP